MNEESVEKEIRQKHSSADSIRQPLHEFNPEDKMLQKVNTLTLFPRFHEDMDKVNAWNTDESSILQEYPKRPTYNPSQYVDSKFRDNDKATPLKNPNSGECLTKIEKVCGQYFIDFTSSFKVIQKLQLIHLNVWPFLQIHVVKSFRCAIK